MKNLLILLMFIATFVACDNAGNKTSDKKSAALESVECSKVDVDSFLVIAENYIGKEMSVCGTVDHVCKHGGKKVSIYSSCPSHGIKGMAGENIGIFEPEIEGSNICITGIVVENKIDMAYVDEWEAKVKSNEGEHAHAEEGKGCNDHNPAMEQIQKHRKMIEESEKGYLPYYTIEVEEFHVCTSVEKTCCDKKAEADKKACCDKEKEEETKSSCCDKKKEGCAEKK